MNFSSYSDVYYDERFIKWNKKWDKIDDDDEQLVHLQKFFRMILSTNTASYYYSFCDDDVYQDNHQWHCIKCQKCLEWREWHCGECDKCIV